MENSSRIAVAKVAHVLRCHLLHGTLDSLVEVNAIMCESGLGKKDHEDDQETGF